MSVAKSARVIFFFLVFIVSLTTEPSISNLGYNLIIYVWNNKFRDAGFAATTKIWSASFHRQNHVRLNWKPGSSVTPVAWLSCLPFPLHRRRRYAAHGSSVQLPFVCFISWFACTCWAKPTMRSLTGFHGGTAVVRMMMSLLLLCVWLPGFSCDFICVNISK